MPITPNKTAFLAPLAGYPHAAPAHAVYTRTAWSDPWVLQPHLYANWASWVTAPGMSTAELGWNYGYGKFPDRAAFELVLPDSGARRYVKIEWTGVDVERLDDAGLNKILPWYGIVNGLGTRQGGVRDGFADPDDQFESGQQVLQLVGLEKLLDDTIVRTSTWYDYEEAELCQIDRGLTFNAPKADGTLGGNMASLLIDGASPFSGLVLIDDEFWALNWILPYLVKYHPPRDKTGDPLPLTLEAAALAGLLGDRPTLATHGRSVRELLNQLLTPERFLTWRLAVDDDNNLVIVVVSLAGENLVLPSSTDLIVANPRRWKLNTDQAPGDVSRVLSHAEAVDRVRIQGARGTSTFTVSPRDETLEGGWNPAEELKYLAGAGGTSAYVAAGANKALKKKLDREARTRDELRFVWTRYVIPETFAGLVGDGLGTAADPVHFQAPWLLTTETTGFRFYKRELYLQDTLPLKDGYDYRILISADERVDPVRVTAGPHNHLPPLVLFPVPGSVPERYVHVEKIGLGADVEQVPGDPSYNFSARVTIPRRDRAIVVEVTGNEEMGQCVLAGQDFTEGKLHDTDGDSGNWDWRLMICTVSCETDYFCEGVYPPTAAVANNDHVREVILQAPDDYRLDWLVPGTVINITNGGELVRCTAGGWIQDDRQKLTDRACLAFTWYGTPRTAIQVTALRVGPSIAPGDYVAILGEDVEHQVNSVVTEIRVDQPPAPLGSEPSPPTISYTTDLIRQLDLYLSPNLQAASKPLSTYTLPPGSHSSDVSMHQPFGRNNS